MLPSTLKCISTGTAATPTDAHRMLKAASPALARLPLSELFIAHANELYERR